MSKATLDNYNKLNNTSFKIMEDIIFDLMQQGYNTLNKLSIKLGKRTSTFSGRVTDLQKKGKVRVLTTYQVESGISASEFVTVIHKDKQEYYANKYTKEKYLARFKTFLNDYTGNFKVELTNELTALNTAT